MCVRRYLVCVFVFTLFAVGLASSATAIEPTKPIYGGTLVIGMDRDVLNIDPHQWTANATRKVMLNVYEGLVRQNEHLQIVPQLARSWEISEDGLVYTFHLVQGARFHNGREFVADDVKYSIERIQDPKTGHPYIEDYQIITDVTVIDDYTVQIKFARPCARGLQLLAGNWCAIVPKEVVEQYGDLNAHPCGTGPFVFKERVAEDHVTLVAFKDYYEKGIPYLDKVIFKVIPEEFSRMADLKAGNIDVLYGVSPEIVATLKKDPNVNYLECSSSNVAFLYLHTQVPPFDDVRVRQAVNYGINREELVTALFGGLASPIAQLVPPNSPVPVKQIEPIYDPDKAKALLAEAGYPNGGVRVTFDAPVFSKLYKELGDLIQLQLMQVGFDVKMSHIDPGTYEEKVIRNKDFQMSLDGTSEHPDPDVKLYVRAHTGAVTNIAEYSNPIVDELLERGRIVTDVNARAEIYNEVMAILYEEAPIIPLLNTKWYLFVRKRVHNMPLDGLTMLQLREVWVEPE